MDLHDESEPQTKRRAHLRVLYECPVVLTAPGQVWEGHTKNISEGGAYVSTFRPPQVDTLVDATLRLVDGRGTLQMLGCVCWARGVTGSEEGEPPGCGIRFLSPSSHHLAILRSIVASRPVIADRRVYQRAPFRVNVTFSSAHTFYTGITDDICEGGVFVATPTPPERGTLVRLQLSLPSLGKPVVLNGEVRWLRDEGNGLPAGCGIRWLTLPPNVVAAIQDFVEKRPSIFFEDS